MKTIYFLIINCVILFSLGGCSNVTSSKLEQALSLMSQPDAPVVLGDDGAGGLIEIPSFQANTGTNYGDMVVGDSISTNTGHMSWFEYTCLKSMGKLQYVGNAAVGNTQIQYMIDNFDTKVAPYKPARVHIMAGTNNWPLKGTTIPSNDNNATLNQYYDTFMQQYDTLVKKVLAINAIPILYAMPPMNGQIYTARVQEGNLRYKQYAQLHGYTFLDPWVPLINATTGEYLSSYTDPLSGFFYSKLSVDGTHPMLEVHGAISNNVMNLISLPAYGAPHALPTTADTGTVHAGLAKDPFAQTKWGIYTSDTNITDLASVATASTVTADHSELGNWSRIEISNSPGVVMASTGFNYSNIKVGDTLLFVLRLRVSNLSSGTRYQVRLYGAPSVLIKAGDSPVDGIVHAKFKVATAYKASTAKVELWALQDSTVSSTQSGRYEFSQIGIYNLTTMGLE